MNTRPAARCGAVLTVLALALVLLPGIVTPASAAARVRISNVNGDAVVDPTYQTTLTLRGRGFQSVKSGHGGIYVLFGVLTSGRWKPSQGGHGYLTVPDSQTKDNAGYAKFVAFPGSDTAGSANGGTIKADGSWTTTITVPGATFTTSDASGRTVRVDCRVKTCGVLTVGAHGVVNAHNETFTRVRVAKVVGASEEPTSSTASGSTGTTTAPVTGRPAVQQAPTVSVPPALEVDRASAAPGRVLSFSADGLDPGAQVTATFEDGRAAVGPLTVGATGEVAGVLQLPADLTTGTFELRIVGGDKTPAVRFAVVAPKAAAAEDAGDRMPTAFAGLGGAALLAAIAAAVLIRRKQAHRA